MERKKLFSQCQCGFASSSMICTLCWLKETIEKILAAVFFIDLHEKLKAKNLELLHLKMNGVEYRIIIL
jgi:hypothetical protein